VLRDEEQHRNLSEAVEIIFRAVHSLKGNAALLDLKFLAEKANKFEDKMSLLRDNKDLTWEHFIPIAYDLAKLQEVNIEMEGLVERIRRFENKGIDNRSALAALPDAINELAQRIAGELGKKIRFVASDVDFGGISNKYAYVLRDIIVQLTRNAITHGIENPDARAQAGKDECGTLILTLRQVGENFALSFRDDGTSFNFAGIRDAAVQSGKGTPAEVEKWEAAKLIKLIFGSGFSTAEAMTRHAGRGMGMDIIRQRIRKIGGQLKINYFIGKFTEFKIIFPLATLQQPKESV
jgi:chemotaxis protein histidine kinase CheA